MSEITMPSLPSERLWVAKDAATLVTKEFGPESPAAPAHLRGDGAWNISLEIITDLASVANVWRTFEKSADCTPFQIFGWLNNWQRHIGAVRGSRPILVLGRDRDGELLFILPLAIEKRKGMRRLTWLGVDLGDYDGPLLSNRFVDHRASEDFVPVWKSVVALLRSDKRFRFDIADLPKMPEMIGGQKNPFLQLKVLPNRSGAYIATLGTNWEEYFAAKRSASTRKTLRRKQKQLEAHGKLAFKERLEPEASVETLAVLIEQKSCAFSRMGVENIFRRPGYPEFYRAMVTDPETAEFVHVSRLDVGTAIGATTIALSFRQRYYLVLSSYHAGEMAKSGPGRTLLHELLRYAIERKFRYFDFTIGDESYKLDWADTKLVLYNHLAAHTVPGWVVASAITFLRHSIRFIKQRPTLWRFAVTVRALIERRKRGPAGPAEEAD
jgi:CelD/BcsL family acetyltransferase involved in cellulose biosynthesis